MSNVVCLDSSVLVKLLTWEDESETAAHLMEKVVEREQTVVLPDFAWAEVGSVLRRKARTGEISAEDMERLWKIFRNLKVISYIGGEDIAETTWRISMEENLPTLYDAAYMAVAEKSGGEFWTADEKLVNSLGEKRKYVKLLREFN